MSQPPVYTRQSNFTDWSTNNPELPHDGTELDSEFNAIKTTLDATLTNISLIQRDDGELANAIVGSAQLAPEILANLGGSVWETDTEYLVDDSVFYNNAVYNCVSAHESDVFATDLSAGKWEIIVDFSGDYFSSASVTSTLIDTGSKTFVVTAGKNFSIGASVMIISDALATNYMFGTITSYSGTSLTVNVTVISGSGTFADWTISVSGIRGATGAAGADGSDGGGLTTVSATDTTSGYLNVKLVVGDGLSLSTNNGGANETRQIDLSANIKNTANLYMMNFK